MVQKVCRLVQSDKLKVVSLATYQMNLLRAILDGVHSEFTTREVLQKYQLGSSANVSIVKRALVKKELIEVEKRQVVIPDPVMRVWLKKEIFLGGGDNALILNRLTSQLPFSLRGFSKSCLISSSVFSENKLFCQMMTLNNSNMQLRNRYGAFPDCISADVVVAFLP